ncbi:MAG TPA: TSUP family transporter [Gemmatimonadaceae bacterium]|nr:TSUP family transporter [Gemmatimonadaceae bacterium]
MTEPSSLLAPAMHTDARDVLLLALGLLTAFFVAVIVATVRRARRTDRERVAPPGSLLATGFIANFFDTLGIGSFATTTAIFRKWRLVRDERIPGTLNAGHTLPTIAQAFIYTKLVPVNAGTLIGMIAAAVLGAWLGAGVVARWPRRRIQIGMSAALLGAALLMLLAQLKLVPAGGDLLRLDGSRLVLGLAGNFALGALMTIGIGLYAPCMILVSLLGMNPTAAFPIMMGSCAFLMPVASTRFIRKRSVDVRAMLGLLIGGIPAVLLAAFVVKSLPLAAVRWLVVIVVVYTAIGLLRAALRPAAESTTADAVVAEASTP